MESSWYCKKRVHYAVFILKLPNSPFLRCRNIGFVEKNYYENHTNISSSASHFPRFCLHSLHKDISYVSSNYTPGAPAKMNMQLARHQTRKINYWSTAWFTARQVRSFPVHKNVLTPIVFLSHCKKKLINKLSRVITQVVSTSMTQNNAKRSILRESFS